MEHWKDIPGYEGLYQASTEGRVRSLDRIEEIRFAKGSATRLRRGRLLQAIQETNGYLAVNLTKNGQVSRTSIHRVVALTFLGAPDPGLEVCHNNGEKADNRLSNLRWDTRSSNQKDRKVHGTTTKGQKHSQAKLTEQQVLEIRRSLKKQREIAQEYGVTQATVSCIKLRKSWSHLPDPVTEVQAA